MLKSKKQYSRIKKIYKKMNLKFDDLQIIKTSFQSTHQKIYPPFTLYSKPMGVYTIEFQDAPGLILEIPLTA